VYYPIHWIWRGKTGGLGCLADGGVFHHGIWHADGWCRFLGMGTAQKIARSEQAGGKGQGGLFLVVGKYCLNHMGHSFWIKSIL